MMFFKQFRRFGVAGVVAASMACGSFALAATPAYLDPGEAFRGSAQTTNDGVIVVRIDVAPGYHLYRDRIATVAEGAAARFGKTELPRGESRYDENFRKDVEVLEGAVVIGIPVETASADFNLKVEYQGCADRGLCYPPQSANVRASVAGGKVVRVAWQPEEPFAAAALPSDATATAPAPALAAASSGNVSESARVESVLKSGRLVSIAGVFLVAGLLLAFTPCVLPMVPILSSIIVGEGGAVSRGRGFAMAVAYSLGMAMVYTAFGVVAGLLGEGLAAALQNPWVLGAFASLLALLSLSMFGAFELQMPSAIQSRLTASASRLPGGRFAGVFLMGGLSALIVGPCVAAPLAGALVFISQTRNVVIGGVALFSLALGMSVPLLLVGMSAGALLPRAGAWMEGVKVFFGVLLLGVALWIVSPVLPASVFMGILGTLCLIGAVYLRLLDRLPDGAPGRQRFGKGVALVLAVLGATQIVGALSGGSNPLQPLARWNSAPAAVASAADKAVKFQRVQTLGQLDAALQTANRPVLLDFYADWCVSCKEMEHLTFSDTAVRGRMSNALLLQADVTANSSDDKALLKRFGLFGPPGIVFFDARGNENLAARVIGYVPPSGFLESLSVAGL